jgi:ABC-type multidrug transport system fused ATPase/permease subunit
MLGMIFLLGTLAFDLLVPFGVGYMVKI